MNRLNILIARYVRKDRQKRMTIWVARCFGTGVAVSLEERAARLYEESCELAQACGLSEEMADRIKTRVWSNPPGDIAQEIGGVSTTLLVLAENRGLSADECEQDECEQAEMERVESLPDDHFRKRHAAKTAAGMTVVTAVAA